MHFKNIEAWLRIYKTLPSNDLLNFGKYIRQDSELLAEFNELLTNLSDPESVQIVDPVFHQIFNFYRSSITELRYFSIELLPKVIDTYLISYYTEPEHLPACIGAFLLGIYNLTVTGNVSVISKEALNLHKASIYHDPPPISLTINKYNNNVCFNNYNNNNNNNNNMVFKKFESINAYNRSEILSHVLSVYNWHICLMSIDSQQTLCHLCSRLCRLGFHDVVEADPQPPQATPNNNSNNQKESHNINNNKNKNTSTTKGEDGGGNKNDDNFPKTPPTKKVPRKGISHSFTKLTTTKKADHLHHQPPKSLSPVNLPNHPSSHPSKHSFTHSSSYYYAHSSSTSPTFCTMNQSIQPFTSPSIQLSTTASSKYYSTQDLSTHQVKIPFTAPLFLELLKGIYFLIFNGLSYLSLQSLEDCHLRASYEMNAQVLLVTNAILNSVQQMASSTAASSQKDNRHYQHLIPLSPSLSLPSIISLSKDAITSASFKTKKLPEDIEVQDHSDPPQAPQQELQLINTSLSTSENLDLSALAPSHEATPDSDKNPFSRIPIISMIKNKEKSFRNMQQRSKEGAKDGGKDLAREAREGREVKDAGGDISSLFSGLGQRKASLATKSNSEHNMLPFKFNADGKNDACSDASQAHHHTDEGDEHKTPSTNAPTPDVAFKSRLIKSLHINKNRFHHHHHHKTTTNNANNNNSKNNSASNLNKSAMTNNNNNDDVNNGYVMTDWSMEGRRKFDWSMNEDDYDYEEYEDEEEDGDDNDAQDDDTKL